MLEPRQPVPTWEEGRDINKNGSGNEGDCGEVDIDAGDAYLKYLLVIKSNPACLLLTTLYYSI